MSRDHPPPPRVTDPTSPAGKVLGAVDRLQERIGLLGFLIGVQARFSDDRGPHFSALLAYYGFFSFFPLLLALVSILGIVLRGHPGLQEDILDTALANFPVIGDQLTASGGTIPGNGLAVVFGIAGALWAGLGAVYAAQDAMDTMWSVPLHGRPKWLQRRVRGLGTLLVVGGGILGGTAVASVGTQVSGLPGVARWLTVLGTVVVNAATLAVAFKILTVADVRLRQLWPGAIAGGIALWGLQVGGSWYLTRVVSKASATYGTFALVIGLLTWIALQARVVLLAAEINVVRDKRFWPRSVRRGFPTEADRRAYDDVVAREVRHPEW